MGSDPLLPPSNNTDEPVAPIRPSIHTLEGDLYSTIKDGNYSNNIVKIATQPHKVGTSSSATKNFPHKKIFVISGLLIAVIIGVGAYFVISTENKRKATDRLAATDTQASTSTTTSIKYNNGLLDAEAIIRLNLKNLNKFEGAARVQEMRADLREKNINKGTSVILDLNLSMSEFFSKNQYSGDEGLIRSLVDKYSFGIYNNNTNLFESFVVFKVINFDQAFASMLSWEQYMLVDFKELFSDKSTSTTTDVLTMNPSTFIFKDKIIQNTDVRVHLNSDGAVDFVYGFLNKNYLIITNGIESFADTRERLLNDNTLR